MERRSGKAGEGDPWWRSHYGAMLLEDVRNGVMPIGGQARHATAFTVGLGVGSNASARTVAEAISGRTRFQGRDLAGVVCDWVSGCAARMLQNGRAEYTVRGESAAVRIMRPGDHGESSVDRKDIGTRIAHLPRSYDEPFAAMQAALRIVWDPRTKGKLLGYFEPGEERVPFEYDVFRQEEARVLARATAFVGWNGRNSFHPKHGQNAYHFVYRELRFHGFKAMLRNRALICLNECLQLVGDALGNSIRVEVTGLPSEEDAWAALKQLEQGQTSFSSVLDPFRL